MSTKIVDTASALLGQGRLMFNLSNGNALAVIPSDIDVKVYETSAADRKSGWTLRATIAFVTSFQQRGVTAALFSDNSVGIAVIGYNNTAVQNQIWYCKLTYSGYSVGAWESVYAVSSGSVAIKINAPFDMDITDTGVVVIGAVTYSASGTSNPTFRPFCRTTGNSWVAGTTYLLTSGGSQGDTYVTLTTLGISGGVRRVVFVTNTPYLGFSSTVIDGGFELFTATVTESSGAWGTVTKRAAYFAGLESSDPNSSGWQFGARMAKLYRTVGSVDQYHLAMVKGYSGSGGGTSNFIAYGRGSWDGTTWISTYNPKTVTFFDPHANLGEVLDASRWAAFGITVGLAGISVNLVGRYVSGNTTFARAGIMQIVWTTESDTPTGIYTVRGQWLDGAVDAIGVWSNGNRNVTNKHDTLMMKSDYKPYHVMAPTLPLPNSIVPDNGQTVTTGQPTLSMVMQYSETYWAPSHFRAHWQISQDSTFATGVRDIQQGLLNVALENDMDGSINTPVIATLSMETDGLSPITSGTWYIRGRIEDSYGGAGAWTTDTRQFIIGHPPTAVPLSPLNNRMMEYGGGQQTFSWAFQDSFANDTQSAYQLRLRVADATGTIIYDSGKITSTAKSATITVPSANKNQTLYWEVRLWDSEDGNGVYSTGNSYFTMIDPATASITAPTMNQVLSAGTMTLSSTVAATGGRTVKEYQYRILREGAVVWVSDRVLGTFSNGQTLPYIIPAGVLANNTQYSVQVLVIDDAGVNSLSGVVPFSTSWTVAVSVTSVSTDVTQYNVDGAGYVRLSWTDENRESGFVAWNIYRRDDIVDPYGITIQAGTYKLVRQDPRAVAGTYIWDDYYAPAAGKVNYLIKQLVNRGGFYVESENLTPATASPVSDAYWLIDDSSGTPVATKLYLVTSDSYTDETEEAEYNVVGRGRHVDKGEYLGPKGTLVAELRDSMISTVKTILMNGDFETDIAGWAPSSYSSIVTRSTTRASSGVASLRAQVAVGGTVAEAAYQSFNTVPGRVHTIKAKIYSAGDVSLGITWFTPDGIYIGSGTTTVTSNNTFAQVTHVTTAPPNAGYGAMFFWGLGLTAGAFAYIDEVSHTYIELSGTARQKRLKLLELQQKNAPLWLRNPFGDIFKVNVSSMQVGRIAGVGQSEFCDVTIPYAQVG